MIDQQSLRTVIAGVPRAGKTTLAKKLGEERGCQVRHLDDLVDNHSWSEASLAASRYFDEPGPWIIEGVSAARALRKWLARNPTGKPCDEVLMLSEPKVSLSKGQETMGKGVLTVWNQIEYDLQARMTKPEPFLRGITVCVEYSDILSVVLKRNLRHFSEYCIVTSASDTDTQELAASLHVCCHATNSFYHAGAHFNKWKALEEGLSLFGRRGWMCIHDADILFPAELPDAGNFEIGKLYTPHRRMYPTLPIDDADWKYEGTWSKYRKHANFREWAGYCHIFHADDPNCKQVPWYEPDWIHAGGADSMFQARWDKSRKVRPGFDVLHFGPAGSNWMGRTNQLMDGRMPPDSLDRSRRLRDILDARKRRRQEQGRQGDPYEGEKLPPTVAD